jgi:hypothetical protein
VGIDGNGWTPGPRLAARPLAILPQVHCAVQRPAGNGRGGPGHVLEARVVAQESRQGVAVRARRSLSQPTTRLTHAAADAHGVHATGAWRTWQLEPWGRVRPTGPTGGR